MDVSYRCYVISLAREQEKRAEFFRRNSETGLPCEVFDAIDGRTIAFDEFVRNGTVKEGTVNYTQGMLGCTSSHRALWAEADRTQQNLLIFEDDVYCRKDIARQIEMLLSELRAWDIVLLGYNTNSVLDFRISGSCNLTGTFSNKAPSVQQLAAYSQETPDLALMRLNTTFGLCSYLVSPQGARKLLSLFPMDNRPLRIPGIRTRDGTGVVPCTTVDMMTNTLYAKMNAYVTVPPLALPLNDQATSTTLRDDVPPGGAQAVGTPAPPAESFVHRRSRSAVEALVKSVARRFGYEIRRMAPPR